MLSRVLKETVGVRTFSTAAASLAPAVKSKRELNAKKARERKIERREARKRVLAKKPASHSALFMDVSTALRYLRAAEVGRPVSEASISVQTQVLSTRGAGAVQGAVRLPKPLKETRILCISAEPEKRQEALEAGATEVKEPSFIDEIADGKAELNYDMVVATPDVETQLRKVARILGPRGLMPSVKRGTLTAEVGELIGVTMGTQPFRERKGMVSLAVARADFDDTEILKNLIATSSAIKDAVSKVKSKKPILLGDTVLSSTHGPGIVINF